MACSARRYVLVWAALIALLILSPVAAMAQWFQYQGNASHTGYVAETVAAGQLARRWETTFLYDGSPALRGGVAVNNQGVFAVSYAGSDYHDYDLVSLNTATGTQQWKTRVTSYAYSVSAPSLEGDTVYVHSFGHSGIAGGNSSQYPYLMGVDSGTGSVRFATTHSGQWNAGCRPTVFDGQAVALGGYTGGMDSYVASTGARQWSINLPQQYEFIPAMDAQRIYIYYGQAGSSPGPRISTLYTIDRQTGDIDRMTLNPTDGSSTYSSISSVVLGSQGDAIVANAGYKEANQLTSFSLNQPGIRWTRAISVVGAVAVADGTIAVPTSNALKMIDEATGSDIWTWAVPGSASLTSNVVLTQNMVFVASDDTLFALNRSSGQLSWSEYVGSDNNGYFSSGYSLAYFGGTLYASGGSRILAYNAVPEPSGLAVGGMGVLIALRGMFSRHRRTRL